jgi:hypothetical protein
VKLRKQERERESTHKYIKPHPDEHSEPQDKKMIALGLHSSAIFFPLHLRGQKGRGTGGRKEAGGHALGEVPLQGHEDSEWGVTPTLLGSCHSWAPQPCHSLLYHAPITSSHFHSVFSSSDACHSITVLTLL